MNNLEKSMVKVNIESMYSKDIIDSMKSKMQYLPNELAILELGIKDNNKNKQVLAAHELLRDMEILNIMANSLVKKLYLPREYSFAEQASTIADLEAAGEHKDDYYTGHLEEVTLKLQQAA